MQDLINLRRKKIAAMDTPFEEGVWRHKETKMFYRVECFFYPSTKWVAKPIINKSHLTGRHEYGEAFELDEVFWDLLESWL